MLGAAAFLIAEFLKISYLDVIWMATIPTCLYYLSLLFMVELDAKRFGARDGALRHVADAVADDQALRLPLHLADLVIVFMMCGYSPMLSVFYSTVLSFALSFLTRETALTPKRLVQALADGSIGVLNAATTCASAGIIVGVVTLTGLGLKFSSIVLDYAGGSLLLTALYTSLVVWIVGLAVPVTASYIICAVIAAPALIKLGVPDFAAHMFIFYYAVLSEVSPPTALSPFAAAAITGGDPYRTTLQAWKYTLPAFLVPFVFVLDPQGVGLLMKIPDGRLVWSTSSMITAKTALGLAALAAAAQDWALRQNTLVERVLLALAGLLLVFPSLLEGMAGDDHRPRHRYTGAFGLAIGVAVAAKTTMQPTSPIAPVRPAETRSKDRRENNAMKRRGLICGALGLPARRCSRGAALAQQKTSPSRTGGTGGVYYPLGGGMANVLSKYVPGVAGDRARSPAARSTISS